MVLLEGARALGTNAVNLDLAEMVASVLGHPEFHEAMLLPSR